MINPDAQAQSEVTIERVAQDGTRTPAGTEHGLEAAYRKIALSADAHVQTRFKLKYNTDGETVTIDARVKPHSENAHRNTDRE